MELRILPAVRPDGAIPAPAELALRQGEIYFRSLVENARDVIHVINADRTTRYVTPSVTRLLGWRPEELVGRSALDLVHPDDLPRALQVVRESRDGGAGLMQFRVPHRDGSWRVFEAVGRNLLDDPVVRGVIVNSRDVTERIRAEEETARLAAFPRESPNPILECGPLGEPLYVNPAAERLMHELGLGPAALLPADHARLCAECHQRRAGARDVEVRVGERVFAWEYHPQPDAGTVHLFAQEVTERKRAEDRLRHAALHDALTGLPNRQSFLEQLTLRLARPGGAARGFALLFLDLDRFKVVNDSLGHHVGDDLLDAVARRLRGGVQARDLVARFGGDEFAVLLDGVDDAARALGVAERLAARLSEPVALGDYEVFTGASIGIVLAEGREAPEHLIRDADMAMYRAKAAGVGPCVVFDRAMHHEAVSRLQLETDLRRAAERRELRLHYQPIVSLATGRVAAFEALLRWQHPRRGLVPPDQFVPLAEETGLILPIGEWVLAEAARQLAAWRRDFPGARIAASVNLSARQLSQRDLGEKVAAAVAGNGLDPRHLKLEITESAVMENAEAARQVLAELRERGFQVQMDDFGTGYSSLSSLHRLPLDALKIDRSFVGRLDTEPGAEQMVRAIAGLAQGLGMSVVAEGVETPAQLAQVRELGCHYAQGYLLSPPLQPERVPALLAAGLRPA